MSELKPEILLIVLASLTGVSALAFLTLFWRLSRIGRSLRQVRAELAAEEPDTEQATARFAGDLKLAEIKQNLDLAHRGGRLPERYQYVASLSEHGLEPAQIAGILDLGCGEVEQLVELAGLARRAEPPQPETKFAEAAA